MDVPHGLEDGGIGLRQTARFLTEPALLTRMAIGPARLLGTAHLPLEVAGDWSHRRRAHPAASPAATASRKRRFAPTDARSLVAPARVKRGGDSPADAAPAARDQSMLAVEPAYQSCRRSPLAGGQLYFRSKIFKLQACRIDILSIK